MTEKTPFPELDLTPTPYGDKVSTSGRVLDINGPAPDPETDHTGQHRGYWVLSEEERGKGFVRPVRRSYKHLTCGTVTTMGAAIAETYARQPSFYGATFCCHCRAHFPVGEQGQFVWEGTDEKVGT